MKKTIQALLRLKAWAKSERPIDHFVQGTEQGLFYLGERIFNSDSGTRDIKGAGLGGYSSPYAKYRQSKGRQTANVDLELTGELRRSIKTVRSGTTVGIAIDADRERKIASYLEARYGKQIFELSDDEKQKVMDTISNNFKEDFNDIVNGNL